MVRARDPYCAVRFKHSFAGTDPFLMKRKIRDYAFALIPLAFINADTLASMYGKSTVREMIRRIGENHINGVSRKLPEEY